MTKPNRWSPDRPLTEAKYKILHAFVYPRKFLHGRPDLGDLCKLLGGKTRGGVYCGHIVPLMERGYITRDKGPFVQRAYCITKFGRKAVHAHQRRLRNEHLSQQNSQQVGDSGGHQVASDGAAAEAIEHAAQLRYLAAVVLLRATVQ